MRNFGRRYALAWVRSITSWFWVIRVLAYQWWIHPVLKNVVNSLFRIGQNRSSLAREILLLQLADAQGIADAAAARASDVQESPKRLSNGLNREMGGSAQRAAAAPPYPHPNLRDAHRSQTSLQLGYAPSNPVKTLPMPFRCPNPDWLIARVLFEQHVLFWVIPPKLQQRLAVWATNTCWARRYDPRVGSRLHRHPLVVKIVQFKVGGRRQKFLRRKAYRKA